MKEVLAGDRGVAECSQVNIEGFYLGFTAQVIVLGRQKSFWMNFKGGR